MFDDGQRFRSASGLRVNNCEECAAGGIGNCSDSTGGGFIRVEEFGMEKTGNKAGEAEGGVM